MGNIKKPKHGPEWFIQRDLIRYLRDRGWMVEPTNGNKYQTGFPDLLCKHRDHATRWIDCKQPKKYAFTNAQKLKWPVWDAHGIGIWILTAATQAEYDKLFEPPNWMSYWKPSWGTIPDIDELIAEIIREEAEEAKRQELELS